MKPMQDRRWRPLHRVCRPPTSTRAPSAPHHAMASGGARAQALNPTTSVYHITGALASRFAARQALVEQHRCVILATNALDDTLLPARELFAGYEGQGQAERGFRLLKDPHVLASSLDLKKPARIMALFMVMTVCLLVYAALEYR